MKKFSRIITFIFLYILSIFCIGCSKDAFYPASDIQITKTDPYNILPTSSEFSSIDDGVISIKLINSIPCELVSYDISYKTALNEPIDTLSMSDIFVNLPFPEANTETDITIKPYTQQVMKLFESTTSNISPIRALVTLHFKDVNENEIKRTASFLLYKYEESSSSE